MTTTEHLTTDPGYRLCYLVPHEAWYKRVVGGQRVTVSKSADEGGCAWEFDIVLVRNIGLRLEIFDDAYAAFTEIAPLFAALAARPPGDLAAVCALLEEFGLPDVTPREDPRPADARLCDCGCDESACRPKEAR